MSKPLTTTLNHIREHNPCRSGWQTLLKGLGKTEADDEPLEYSRIAEINGIEDALWCCCAEPQYWRTWRLFAVWAARQVQHLMTDAQSIAALDVAERHANGTATDEELAVAVASAWDAAVASVGTAAGGAAGAAVCTADWDSTWTAAGTSVGTSVWVSTWAATKASTCSFDWGSNWATTRAAQFTKFKEMVS